MLQLCQGGSRGTSKNVSTRSPRTAAKAKSPQRVVAGERFGHRVRREPPGVCALERMGLQLATHGPAMEHDRVERHAGEPEPQPVEHARSRRAPRSGCRSPLRTSFTAISDAE